MIVYSKADAESEPDEVFGQLRGRLYLDGHSHEIISSRWKDNVI